MCGRAAVFSARTRGEILVAAVTTHAAAHAALPRTHINSSHQATLHCILAHTDLAAYWTLDTGHWILDTPPNVSNSSHLARAKVGDESGRWWVAAGAREVSSNQCPVQSCCCPHMCRYNQMLERDLI